MKIAIAQIDMRLGDIDAICARIEDQAALAHEQGARLLCTPVPLFSGAAPGPIVESANFQHDLIACLSGMAMRLAQLDIAALVPAFVAHQGAYMLEVFLLKDGNVSPLRTLLAIRREQAGDDDLWTPPVFDVDGVRCAITFDVEHAGELLPPGCDLMIYFQAGSLDVSRVETSAVAAVQDGHFRPVAVKRSLWLACVAPVGGFDGAIYAGGSFVMDDCGRVVAASPCFEEDLLVQDVQRGTTVPCIEDHELPHFDRSEWLWDGLRVGLVDAATACGCSRAALVLDGSLPSSLAATLCVDAFGPRNVVGLFVARSGMRTPAQDAAERERAERVRDLVASLHIRLVERTEPDCAALLDRDESRIAVPGDDAAVRRASAHLAQLFLDDIAHAEHALPVSSLTKTDYALAPEGAGGSLPGQIAPFGDVYLTALEFVARMRNRAGAAVPAALVSLRAVKSYLDGIIRRAAALEASRPYYAVRVAEALGTLEPSQIDAALEAHIDRDLPLDDLPLAATRPDAAALLLMLVRRGEAARRALPLVPAVSARSLGERAWPVDLAWSDLGRHGADPLDLAGLARTAIERAESRGEALSARVRGEIMGLVGSLLGITPEQLEAMSTEEGRQQLGGQLPQLEDQVQRALHDLFEGGSADGEEGGNPFAGPAARGFSFFSQN